MSYDPGNPYASPTAPPPPPGPNPGGLQFMEAFNYVFRSPNWLVNLLLPALCAIIPIAGPMVLLGFQFDIIESLHRSAGRTYPDFDFGRFGQYFMRGLWPFLVGLVASAILVPVMLVLMFVPLMCLGFVGNSRDGASILVVLSFVAMMALMFLFIMVLSFVMIPLQMRAGLMQDFAGAFSFSFVKEFISHTWLEIILQALFMSVAGTVLMIGGTILCIVGVIPAMALTFLAQTHLHYQLYEIYLSRGGDPIPLTPPPAM